MAQMGQNLKCPRIFFELEKDSNYRESFVRLSKLVIVLVRTTEIFKRWRLELERFYCIHFRSFRIAIGDNCSITSLSARTWVSREARDPSLLVNLASNSLRLYG